MTVYVDDIRARFGRVVRAQAAAGNMGEQGAWKLTQGTNRGEPRKARQAA